MIIFQKFHTDFFTDYYSYCGINYQSIQIDNHNIFKLPKNIVLNSQEYKFCFYHKLPDGPKESDCYLNFYYDSGENSNGIFANNQISVFVENIESIIYDAKTNNNSRWPIYNRDI